MVTAHSIQVQVFCKIESIILCISVSLSPTPSFCGLDCCGFVSRDFCLCLFLRLCTGGVESLLVILACDHCIEMLVHDVVVALRLVEDLGHLGVEVVKEREDLPQAQDDADALHLHLEKFCVDALFNQHFRVLGRLFNHWAILLRLLLSKPFCSGLCELSLELLLESLEVFRP